MTVLGFFVPFSRYTTRYIKSGQNFHSVQTRRSFVGAVRFFGHLDEIPAAVVRPVNRDSLRGTTLDDSPKRRNLIVLFARRNRVVNQPPHESVVVLRGLAVLRRENLESVPIFRRRRRHVFQPDPLRTTGLTPLERRIPADIRKRTSEIRHTRFSNGFLFRSSATRSIISARPRNFRHSAKNKNFPKSENVFLRNIVKHYIANVARFSQNFLFSFFSPSENI